MENVCQLFSVPRGYRVHEKITLVDAYTAFYKELPSEKQYRFTCADFIAETKKVKLTEHSCICPVCLQSTPAYKHFVTGGKPGKKVTEREAQAWVEYMYSLLCRDFSVSLYEPISSKDKFRCVHCGKVSKKSEEEICVKAFVDEHKIVVEYPIEDLSDALSIEWACSSLTVDLPLRETVTFNFKTGETTLDLFDCDGEALDSKKIIDGKCTGKLISPLIHLITYNNSLREYLIDSFNDFRGTPVPFKREQLNITLFSLMTQFVGYEDNDFYYRLPSVLEQICSDESLEAVKQRMGNSQNLIKMYEESSLPKIKSVKRIMFSENILLFFYIKELEKLWLCLGENPNNFCSIIKLNNILSILKFLHDFPVAFVFYEDFCKVGKINVLRTYLADSPGTINEHAIIYASLNEHKKQVVRNFWKRDAVRALRGDHVVREYFSNASSLAKLDAFFDQFVGGYNFVPLRSTADYQKAAFELNNCLDSEYFDNPIVGILEANKYVGAIEVEIETRTIVQVHLEDNASVRSEPDIFRAFLKWCNINDFSGDYDDDYFLDNG